MTYQPFRDVAEPFRIGLAPLDPAHMLVRDERLEEYLSQKRELLTTNRLETFAAEPGAADAGAAAADLLTANLRKHHDVAVALDPALPALAAIAMHVQEDLLLMRRADNGWRLVAGSLSFPSSWSLREKFGRPLHAIHAPVPGVNERMGTRITRMFDMMRRPMWRQNWSLQGDDRLAVPRGEGERGGHDAVEGEPRLRLEYQTVTRLRSGPPPGDVLFTVRIFVSPFEALERRRALARRLLGQLDAMSRDELAYKGLAPNLAAVRQRLGEIA